MVRPAMWMCQYRASCFEERASPANPSYVLISDAPEPSTILLLGGALIGLSLVRRRSEFEGRDDEIEDIEEDEVELEEPSFEQPFCPRCGWHNTRPSHTSNAIDLLVRIFGLRPYRCRSCGNRFRAMRRVPKA